MSSEHRLFHYDPDTGRSTPIEEVKLEDGTIALVPVATKEETEEDDREEGNQDA
jgi:hypothetical protein